MKKVFVLSLIVFIMSTIAAARQDRAEFFTRKGMQSTYLEVGGNGLFLTVNYEKFLTNELGLRIGGLIVPTESGVSVFSTIMGNGVWGDGNLCMEAGLGVVAIVGEFVLLATDDSSSTALALTGTLGLRYQPKRKGIIFRLGFTPIIASGGILPWGGVSIGYSFK